MEKMTLGHLIDPPKGPWTTKPDKASRCRTVGFSEVEFIGDTLGQKSHRDKNQRSAGLASLSAPL